MNKTTRCSRGIVNLLAQIQVNAIRTNVTIWIHMPDDVHCPDIYRLSDTEQIPMNSEP
jgi:hypothetical protein